eukprot:334374_1
MALPVSYAALSRNVVEKLRDKKIDFSYVMAVSDGNFTEALSLGMDLGRNVGAQLIPIFLKEGEVLPSTMKAMKLLSKESESATKVLLVTDFFTAEFLPAIRRVTEAVCACSLSVVALAALKVDVAVPDLGIPVLPAERPSLCSIESLAGVQVHDNIFLPSPFNAGNLIFAEMETQFDLILLNSPIGDLGECLLENASRIAVADGGANRIFDKFNEDRRKSFSLSAIVGDFDSIRKDVREFYTSEGVECREEKAQDSTDLDKCLEYLHQNSGNDGQKSPSTVVAYGAFGGRFDHEMAAVQSLFTFSDRFERILLISESNQAELLRPQVRHILYCHPNLEGPTCGLLPVGSRCREIFTQGLIWNLDGQAMEFGGLISTSNLLAQVDPGVQRSGVVEVRCSDPVIWTTTLRTLSSFY